MAHLHLPRHHRPLATLATLGLLLAACGAGHAGPLADPTRPPAALLQAATPQPGVRQAAHAAANGRSAATAPAAAASAAPPPLPPPPPLLQSVQLSARSAATALIDGQLVKAGDSVAGRTVVSIDAQGVLLRSERGSERLSLLSGSTKQPAGSIHEARSALFVPAVAADADGDNAVSPPLDRTGTVPALTAVAKPLSLAGRTAP